MERLLTEFGNAAQRRERAKVVAWLRAEAARHRDAARDAGELWRTDELARANALERAAEAFERGEHAPGLGCADCADTGEGPCPLCQGRGESDGGGPCTPCRSTGRMLCDCAAGERLFAAKGGA
jgi:hypothetical protein